MLMTIVTNIYVLDEDEGLLGNATSATGLMGVYDDMEKANEAWNETLRKVGVPEKKGDLYDAIGHAYIRLGEDGQYIEDESEEKAVYVLELMSKMVKLNVTYRAGDQI
jgi:hypothetical protein